MEISILGDRYEINEQLSRKAGRQTLLALDRETGEQVVIKLLTFSSEFEWESLKLFERETQVLKTLSHPKIPKYLNSFELNEQDSKGFALVQTYIAAPSLESHIKSGRTFSEVEIKQIAESLLETLIYLHTQHPPVIHRDIKPSNILLINRSGNYVGQTYLVDFGAVQTATFKNSGSFTVVGTYGYMPPEQFSGRTTPVSDLYSLGATLIYLVTGQHPANLMTDDLQLEFGQSTTLSPELTRWLQRIVQSTPSQRFANASEALEALKNPQVQELGLPPVQPFGSQITIQQRNDEVCIRLPKDYLNLYPNLVQKCLPFVMLGLFVMIFTVSPWYIVSFIVWGYLLSSFSHKILINDEKISFQMLLMGLKLRTWSYRKEEINRLSFGKQAVPRWVDKMLPGTEETTPEGMKTTYIILNIGTKLCTIQGQNEIEISWLAHELSKYLNLPLNLFEPTASQKDLEKRKLQVTNTPQILEILIPPRGFDREVISWIICIIIMCTFVIPVLWFQAILNPGSWLLALLFLSCLGLYCTWGICYMSSRTVKIRITQSKICVTSKIVGLRYSPSFTASRQNITKIELTRLSYQKNSEGVTVAVPPQINIWAGRKNFSLGHAEGLTDPELDWLARELSNWLNLPIIHVG
jgi:serine/threonine protein kinase